VGENGRGEEEVGGGEMGDKVRRYAMAVDIPIPDQVDPSGIRAVLIEHPDGYMMRAAEVIPLLDELARELYMACSDRCEGTADHNCNNCPTGDLLSRVQEVTGKSPWRSGDEPEWIDDGDHCLRAEVGEYTLCVIGWEGGGVDWSVWREWDGVRKGRIASFGSPRYDIGPDECKAAAVEAWKRDVAERARRGDDT